VGWGDVRGEHWVVVWDFILCLALCEGLRIWLGMAMISRW